jgi:tRNA pseudouridine55 synthase
MGRRRPSTLHGLVVVDKPAGMTSHDVVSHARRRLGERRIGHSGTLDPDATGVLVLGVGSVTRLLPFVGDTKRYRATVVLGVETTTLDAAGDVTAVHDMASTSIGDVRDAARALTGPIMQTPPMVSAVHHEGRRLHELAREGIEVERAPRPVTVHRFDVEPGPRDGTVSVDVECSSGTYVRVLAADLGRSLGGGAHLTDLRRTAVGSFTLADASSLDDISLLPPAAAVRSLVAVTDVDDALATPLRQGKRITIDDRFPGRGPWAVVAGDAVVAVVESTGDGGARSLVVIPAVAAV